MHLLITGEPRVGKSTLLHKVENALEKEIFYRRIVGFITREVIEEGQRTGFSVSVLGSRDSFMLATLDPLRQGLPKVGKYFVYTDIIRDILCPIIDNAVEQELPLVIDEIASIQLIDPVFIGSVLGALDRPILTVATTQLKSNGFTDTIKQRPDVSVVELTQENRERKAGEVYQHILGGLRRP